MASEKTSKTQHVALFRTVPISINASTVRVAMVQIEGPLPDAKIAAVSAGGRETFAWSSMDEVNRRIDKACYILTFLSRQHADTDIVIFPEYSIPVKLALARLQHLSDEHNLIVIAGADNIQQDRGGTVFNQSAVIIPGREPVWISKHNPSQWEEGKIDKPRKSPATLFVWRHGGKKYSFDVNICLDFPTVIRNASPGRKQPVVHFVPMCSPDNATFHTYADTVLWEDVGRAVFLTNCVGPGSAGASSLFAVTPSGTRLRPAVSLSASHEAIAVVELHCDRLVPPKRTSSQPKGGVVEVFLYRIQSSSGGLEIVPAQKEPPLDARNRGVLNPALFAHLGKQLRMTFLGVEGYGII